MQMVGLLTMPGIYLIYKWFLVLCTYHCHGPLTPGQAEVRISGDLQELFDKFPTPGDNFMQQIPYKSPITPLV